MHGNFKVPLVALDQCSRGRTGTLVECDERHPEISTSATRRPTRCPGSSLVPTPRVGMWIRPAPRRPPPRPSARGRARHRASGPRCGRRWPRGYAARSPRRLAGGHAVGEVGHVGRPVPLSALVKDRVVSHLSSSSPACRRRLARVFGRMSSPRCPATVTVPGLSGCFNWQWSPRVRTTPQPSSLSCLRTSHTFMPPFQTVGEREASPRLSRERETGMEKGTGRGIQDEKGTCRDSQKSNLRGFAIFALCAPVLARNGFPMYRTYQNDPLNFMDIRPPVASRV